MLDVEYCQLKLSSLHHHPYLFFCQERKNLFNASSCELSNKVAAIQCSKRTFSRTVLALESHSTASAFKKYLKGYIALHLTIGPWTQHSAFGLVKAQHHRSQETETERRKKTENGTFSACCCYCRSLNLLNFYEALALKLNGAKDPSHTGIQNLKKKCV